MFCTSSLGLWLFEICQKNRRKILYVQSRCEAANWTFFFNRTHRVPAAPRRAAPVRTRYNFSACCRWRISISAAVDPPILPTTIKRLLSSNVYGYGAVITFPDLQRGSRMDTAKANFTPNTLHIVRPARDVYYDNFCAQKRFTVIYARSWN